VVNYDNLGAAYTRLDRVEEAEKVFKQAEERKLESESLLADLCLSAFLKGDTAQMA
jgi:pentatricopeptide repeat protein